MQKVLKFKILLISMILIVASSTALAEIGVEKEIRGYLIGTYENGRVLETYKPGEIRPIASLSKLMTYYVLMDAVENKEVSLEDEIIVRDDFPGKIGSTMNLEAKDHLTLDKVVQGIMIPSANDGCLLIDEYLCGSEEEFVKKMNLKAKELGLKTAVFYNSTGLTEDGQYNKMSMEDLFELTRQLIRNHPEILEYSQMTEMTYKDKTYVNTNPLIGKRNDIIGLKTGATPRAGSCLVSIQTLEHSNDYVISITMGAFDKWKRAEVIEKILHWMDQHYTNYEITNKHHPIDSEIGNLKLPENINAYAKESLSLYDKKNIQKQIQYSIDDLDLDSEPLKYKQVIGNIRIVENDIEVKTIPIELRYSPEIENSIAWFMKQIQTQG